MGPIDIIINQARTLRVSTLLRCGRGLFLEAKKGVELMKAISNEDSEIGAQRVSTRNGQNRFRFRGRLLL